MRSFMLLLPVLFIGGCATTDYNDYLKANKEIEVARETANAAKYRSMSAIANGGDNTAKVAAVLAMALDKQGTTTNNGLQPPPPNQLLQWASILVPGLTQGVGMYMNYKTSVVQSNNAANVAMNTNGSFVAMGNGIAGVANAGVTGMVGISNNGNTALTAVSGAGITGMTNINNNGNAALTAVSLSGNQTASGIAGAGMTGISGVAGLSITGLTTVSGAGMTGMTNIATTGFTSVTGVANSGISGITGVANAGMNNLNNLGNTAINALKITPVP